MFATSLSGNTISAKAKCMYGKRLTEENYNDMLRKSSVSELAAYLKDETCYRSALEQINTHSIHRGQLESLLMRELFNRYTKLCRYNFTGDNDFYNYLILQNEIEQILKCVLSLNAGTMSSFILDLPAYLIHHASFDMMELAKVREFDDLLSVLNHTPYQEIVEQFRPTAGEPIDYAACEKGLMTYHYEHLLETIRKKFRGQTRKDLEKVIRVNVTLTNLMTIYRLKRYFGAQKQEIESLILPFSFKLNHSMLQKLIEAPNADEFFELFHECYYGKNQDSNDNLVFEHDLDQIIYQYNKKLMRFSTSPPAVLYAFIILNNIEVKNIIKVIEGIRYQVPASQIKQLLVL